jgi:hypothetical protein
MARTRQEAEVEDVVRALRGYRVLTRARLLEVCGAAHWSDTGARRALARAVSSGRIKQLGDDLYEIAEPPPDERNAQRDRQHRAIDAAQRQLRRFSRRRPGEGEADQEPGPTAPAQDALRAIRRESSDGRA